MESNQGLPWTGERFVPSCSIQLRYEHLHRYAVAAALADGKRALDIACGEGYGSNLLACTAAQVIGVDIAPDVIAHARKTYPKENLVFREGSCLNIPVQDHSIDFVVSFETIEHIDDPVGFLQEVKRVLAVDGVLIISSPDKAEYTDRATATNPFHKRELYHEEFVHLLKQHFKRCRIGKQKLIAGSWIAPDDPSSEDIFGTFSGDIDSVVFQPGVRGGVYSLAFCSDVRLTNCKLGVYANNPESENIWNLLERFGSPEKIRNTVALLEREGAHKAEVIAHLQTQLGQLREKLTQVTSHLKSTRLSLSSTRVSLSRTQVRADQLTADLRRQLFAARKLTWLLKETERSAARLRASRRWKIANPFAAVKALLSGHEIQGYGHLEKLVSDYLRWRPSHPELDRIDEQIEALEFGSLPPPRVLDRQNGGATGPFQPPPPTRPIAFAFPDSVDISIIIPVFNQLRFTEACLASIQEHPDEQSIEVIVVDDCSRDNTREVLGKVPGVVYLRNENNVGFVASCNYGASRARGKYLLFLNNDTLVKPGWLSALLETFELEPQAGLVGSKLVYPDGRLQEAGGIIWRDGSGWNRGKFDYAYKPEYNYLREVDYCSAACLIIPKRLFEQVGGFDNRYAPGYYEDTDLAFRIREAGFKVLYQPLSEVIHYEGATGGTDLSVGAKKYQQVNKNTFAEKWAAVLQTKPVSGDIAGLEKPRPGQQRILVIDHHVPMFDRDSGSLRMFQILNLLHHLGHKLTFIPDNLAANEPYSSELRRRGIEVVARPFVTSVTEHLRSQGTKYDIIVLSRCGTAKKHVADARSFAPQSRLIFDTVDLHFLRTAREAEIVNDPTRRLLANKTQQEEYGLIRHADETWVVSEAERELLQRDFPDAGIEIVSNIVEIHEPTTAFAERANFLFIGSFLHPPNIDAVLYFTNEIYPLVAECLASAKFYIVGEKAPPEVLALASDNIILTGPIPDVRALFDSVKLSIAPLRYGAGVKGKINQSMGLGVPVVATSIAVEGMSLIHEQDVLVADTPIAFARSLVLLYQSEDTWNRLSQNGLEKTKLLYSPEVARQHLSRLFGEEHTSRPSHHPSIAVAGRAS
jgi:O-antigen biosynthesis protein